MTRRWLILADDLTGAADCAIALGRRGLAAAVTWGDTRHAGSREEPILAYDTASRSLSADAAAARHRDVLASRPWSGRRFFKKIDSTLRGQPAAEIAATLACLGSRSDPAFGVLAAAFPATGRTTSGGRIRVKGRALEETDLWRRDHTYPNADLVDVLATAGARSEKVALAAVRNGELKAILARLASAGDIVSICDAETDHDLRLIAEAGLCASPASVFIGSAGLAHALARLDITESVEPLRIPTSKFGTLTVVGSLADASRSAALRLNSTGTVAHFPVGPDTLRDNNAVRAKIAANVKERLAEGGDVLVEITMNGFPDMSLGPTLVAGLAEALETAVPVIGAFAATGGETAAALLSRFGVNGIRLVEEIEPGVALGLTIGSLSIPIATKAGAFGDEHSLVRINERLRAVRTRGSFI
ncbi:MAG: four-carbon acid sugar kinase family protein [Bradyrhizobium sp.]|nr:four-carbon acid sugar kinase family protein [Bradyrhizobium sp.]